MAKKLKKVFRALGNIRFTIFLLTALFLLILFATFAQVDLGIFEANKRYFSSWFVWMNKTPIFLGGYSIGLLLLINLLSSHTTHFQFTKRYIGIFLIHFGLVLLIIGSGITSFFAKEMQIAIPVSESRNYVEYPSEFELVLIDQSNPNTDILHTFQFHELAKGVHFQSFDLTILDYSDNAIINQRGIENLKFSQLGRNYKLIDLPKTYKMSERNIPGMILKASNQTMDQRFLVWGGSAVYQTIQLNGVEYLLNVRPKRTYLPFSIQLDNFQKIDYQATDTPKSFISSVSLNTPTGASPFTIEMNQPLRYSGYTFFQASFTEDENTSVFQVVKNPSWLIPYISSLVISIGLLLQMMASMKRRPV
ncbi:MAG: cytochrome c biogenesis protein ResB [Candidatus Marinamargulisbacteria bacterium]